MQILRELHEQVKSLYEEYSINPTVILPTRSHLFTSRTLDQRLLHNYDNITCWLWSVSEAKLALAHHISQLRDQSSPFFTPAQFIPLATPPEDDTSTDSYTVSTHDTSDTSTTLDTTTTPDDSYVYMSTTDTLTTLTSASSQPSSTRSELSDSLYYQLECRIIFYSCLGIV